MRNYRPLGVELVTLVYMALTAALTLLWRESIDVWGQMLLRRGIVLLFMAAAGAVWMCWPCRWTVMLRGVPLLLFLVQWYPELYEFCKQFPYLDHLFARADQWLWGGQPSLTFADDCPSCLFSELMCLGYYSYYYLMIVTMLAYYFVDIGRSNRAAFIFLCSFFLFYALFICIPVAGPQYYFAAVGTEAAQTGVLPAVAHFTDDSPCLSIDVQGLFGRLVVGTQEVGERPQAAFPSSHVGMTLVTLALAWQMRRKVLFWVLLPLAALLFASTVYIKAHYLVDVVGAVVLTPLIYAVAAWLYRLARPLIDP